jgi:hypothetical protein
VGICVKPLGSRINFISLARAHNSLGDMYFLLRKIENKIVEKLRTPKGKVNWGRKVVPRKRQCKYSFLKEV